MRSSHPHGTHAVPEHINPQNTSPRLQLVASGVKWRNFTPRRSEYLTASVDQFVSGIHSLHEERDACGLQLIVTNDPDPINPRRETDHLCTMVCWHRRYDLGDKHDWTTPEEFRAAMDERPHIRLPVHLYDRSGITIATTPFSCPWDSGQIGWIFIEEPKLRAEFVDISDPAELQRKAKTLMRAEVTKYDQYLTGDVWCARIGDRNHDTLDSCCGFFGSDYAIEEGRRMLADAMTAFRQEHGTAFAARVEIETPDLRPQR